MDRSERLRFIRISEKMVLPERVAFFGVFSKLVKALPLSWQRKMTENAAKKDPYMGFIVEPYSFFLSYEVKDPKALEDLIPPRYKIIPTSIFKGSPEVPSLIVGAFNLHASYFWGSRIEVYLIVEDQNTGLLSWIIMDYESNTISTDPARGMIGATTPHCVITTSFRGEVIVDIQGRSPEKKITLNADLKNAKPEELNQRLWIEGNLSVDYGNKLGGKGSEPFGMIFDPGEMETALRLPLEDVEILSNTFLEDYTVGSPYESACFPFAQHYITTSIPLKEKIKTEVGLDQAAKDFRWGV